MVKADKLIKEQKDREDIKIKTYDKILDKIEKKILFASKANYYYTWYSVPEFVIGLPLYSLRDCVEYLIKKLNDDGFETEYYEPNLLLVKWFPKK
jgi:hypothetical protein